MKTTVALLSLFSLLLLTRPAQAQEGQQDQEEQQQAQEEQQAQEGQQDQEGQAAQAPYWYTSYYKIPWAKVDSLRKIDAIYSGRMVEEAKRRGNVLDYKVLVHHTGGDYNVVIMTKYPSWQAIETGAGWGQIFEVVEPDSARRSAVNEAMQWIYENADFHRDEIYMEIADIDLVDPRTDPDTE